MHLLEGEGVTKHFGGLAAVSEVDFYVDEGEILGLIGPNGAGKTTLFNLISAALKPKPGKITFEGRDITPLPAYKICRLGIARTFQTVKIFPHVPVVRNVMVGALFGTGRRVSSAEARKKAEEALEFVDMLPLKDLPGRRPHPGSAEASRGGPGSCQRSEAALARRVDGRAHARPRWPKPWATSPSSGRAASPSS